MTVARRLLGLPADASDAVLVGVAPGASRKSIIAAGRARIGMISLRADTSEADALAFRLEIQAAVYRLVTGISPPSGTPRSLSRAAGHRALVLMRRDPRRARLFLAASMRPARQGHLGSPNTGAATHSTVEPSLASHGLDSHDESASPARAPWWLVTVVVMSLLALVGEIVIATRDVAPPAEKSTANPIAPERPTGPTVVAPMVPRREDAPSTPQRNAAPSTETLPTAPIVDGSAVAPMNAEARALRARWQRMAAAALAVTDGEIGPLAASRLTPGDSLAIPLRQGMLLERLIALHDAARMLVAGSDASALRVLDTLPSEAAITVPKSPSAIEAPPNPGDGELAALLARMPGPTEARAALLRNFKTRARSPNLDDARTLVHEALKGPSRATRTLARAILVERGAGSPGTVAAVEERFSELAADPANVLVLRITSGVDPQGAGGASGARAALVTEMLAASGSRSAQVDAVERALAATLASLMRTQGVSAGNATDPAELMEKLAVAIGGQRKWRASPALGDSLRRLVAASTALVRAQSGALVARRPADRLLVEVALVDASHERALAESALAQAIANARGLLQLDAAELGLANPRATRPSALERGHRAEFDAPTDPAQVERWGARLLALTPDNPRDYLELAEEVAAHASDPGARGLARQLAALAAVLDPRGFGSSAAYLLAVLEPAGSDESSSGPEQWRAVAARDGMASASRAVVAITSRQRLDIVEAIAQLRRGYGRRAIDRLRDPQTNALFERLARLLSGGSTEFARLAAAAVNGKPPLLDPQLRDSLLRLERALLVPESERWSDAIALGGDNAAVDAPIGTPEEIFGADPVHAYWRAGRWVTAPPGSDRAVTAPSVRDPDRR